MNLLSSLEDSRPVVFVVPGEVRGKGRPIFTVRGYRDVPDKKNPGKWKKSPIVDAVTDKKTVAYEKMIAQYASLAMRGRQKITRQVRLEVIAYFSVTESWTKKKKAEALAGELPYVSRIDLDNVVKSVSDAINEIVFEDDCQVSYISATKIYGDKDQVVVVVTPITRWYHAIAFPLLKALELVSRKISEGVIPKEEGEIITEALDFIRLHDPASVPAGQEKPIE